MSASMRNLKSLMGKLPAAQDVLSALPTHVPADSQVPPSVLDAEQADPQEQLEELHSELSRYKKSLASSVKATKKLLAEKEELERALQEARRLPDDDAAFLKHAKERAAQLHASLDALVAPLADAEAVRTWGASALAQLDEALDRLSLPVAPPPSATHSSPLLAGSASLEVLLREKRQLEDQLSAERAEHAEVFHASHVRQQEAERRLAAYLEQEKAAKAQLSRQAAELAAERSRVAEELERERARLDEEHRAMTASRAALEQSLSANTQLLAAQERIAALQDELDELRRADQGSARQKEAERLNAQERIAELAALVGALEARAAEDRATIAQLQANAMTAPAAGDLSAVAAEQRAKIDELTAQLAAETKRAAAAIEAAAAMTSSPPPAAGESDVEQLRRQMAAYAAEIDRLRKQNLEQEAAFAALRDEAAAAATRAAEQLAAKDNEMGHVVHDWSAKYDELQRTLRRMRESAEDELEQKNVAIERLSRQLEGLQVAVVPSEVDGHRFFSEVGSASSATGSGASTPLRRVASVTAHHRALEDLLRIDAAADQQPVYSDGHNQVSQTEVMALAAQLRALRQALSETERREQTLARQEKALREELGRRARNESRTMHNLEYLKNIIIKFLESDAATAKRMLGAVAQVLELTDAERAKVERALQTRTTTGWLW